MRAMKYILSALFFCLCVVGCNWFGHEDPKEDDTWSKVMILYSAGFNNISKYLSDNIDDLAGGYIPGEKDDKAVIIVSHLTKNNGQSYLYQTSPQIIRIYKDKKSNPVMDTLKTLAPSDLLTKPSVMESALSYIRDNFKSEHYGLVVSSHGTGWLPSGYYLNSESSSYWTSRKNAARRLHEGAVPYVEEDISGPVVKSLGQELFQEAMDGPKESYELEIPALAASIPMHMDYILMDACLMGGVEVAYELKDVCDYVGFSQAEVLAQGFDYKEISNRLIAPATANPMAVCSDYYDHYIAESGLEQSATISLVDCSQLDLLASVVKDIITLHKDDLAKVVPSNVQGYFGGNKHWFYDVEDIFINAGITQPERLRLSSALSSCVVYKQCTPKYYSAADHKQHDIKTHCGFSMYLPCNGSASLDTFYKTLAWNRATGLVE